MAMNYKCHYTSHHHESGDEAQSCLDSDKVIKDLPFKAYPLQSKTNSNLPHGVSSYGKWNTF
jgi:hypothetical protein